MSAAEGVAAVMFAAVILYAVFGGADFGSGVWDLTAGDARRGAPMRRLIDHAIGPVWEANHVWLIFVLVLLWTGFPGPFADLMRTLPSRSGWPGWESWPGGPGSPSASTGRRCGGPRVRASSSPWRR